MIAKDTHLDEVVARWARAGAAFNTEPYARPIDLERLLLETSRHIPEMARLLPMASTWLARYGDLIAKHRLLRLIRDELEPYHQAILGLLLEASQQQGGRAIRLQSALRKLKPATEPGPLFDIEKGSDLFRRRAERRESDLSKKWKVRIAAFQNSNESR